MAATSSLLGTLFAASLVPCILVVCYTKFQHPTRLLLQWCILIPTLFMSSVVVCVAAIIVKFVLFALIPTPYRIRVLQEFYKAFGLVEWFAFEWWTNLRYVVSGEVPPDIADLNVILMGNHSNTMFDFIVFGSLADYFDRINKAFVLIKKQMLWYPIMGWVEWATPHGVPLSRDWETDKVAIAKLCRTFNANTDYKLCSPWMWFIYPEGTRITPPKLLAAQAFARKRGYDVLQHLLQPRVKGFSYLTHHLSQSLGAVIDCTVLYHDKPPSIKQLFYGTRFCRFIHVHLRVYRKKEIPSENMEALDAWLRARWTEKDGILASMKENKIEYKVLHRTPHRGVCYYISFAALTQYIFVNCLCGASLGSLVSIVAYIAALFPVAVVYMEHSQKMDLRPKN